MSDYTNVEDFVEHIEDTINSSDIFNDTDAVILFDEKLREWQEIIANKMLDMGISDSDVDEYGSIDDDDDMDETYPEDISFASVTVEME